MMKKRKQMKKSEILFPVLLLLLSGHAISADTFRFSADRTTAVLAQGKERTLLTGNARIESKTTVITAERIELYGSDFRYALCSGRIIVTDTEKGLSITCENLFFDRKEEITRVEGWVEMIDLKNEVVAKAGFLENFGKEDITILQIGVRILKQDIAARCEFARYRRDEDILELSGMPVVYKKDDVYRAARIIMNLETDEITMEGNVSGDIAGEKEKEEPAAENGLTPGQEPGTVQQPGAAPDPGTSQEPGIGPAQGPGAGPAQGQPAAPADTTTSEPVRKKTAPDEPGIKLIQ